MPPTSPPCSSRSNRKVSAEADRVWIINGLRHCRAACDMHPEALTLPFEIAGQAVVVESGFADRDHLRVGGEANQPLDRGFLGLLLIRIRMDADGGEDVRVPPCDVEHHGKAFQRHAGAQGPADMGVSHAFEQLRQVRREARESRDGNVNQRVALEISVRDAPWRKWPDNGRRYLRETGGG